MPGIVGPVGRGNLQYAAMWKAAQRMTKKPVKFGTIGPELVAFAVRRPSLQEHEGSHPRDQLTRSTRNCTTSPMRAAR